MVNSCPLAVLLGFGLAQNAIAAPQLTQSTECTNCQTKSDAATDQDSDYDSDNFDNSQDFSQDQSTTSDQGSAQTPPGNSSTQNQTVDDNLNSSDDGDED